MSTLNNGDAMTRAQLLKFNPLWDDRDRAVIEEYVERWGGVRFQYAQSGYNRCVLVFDAEDNELMAVAPGTIYYPPGVTRPGSEDHSSRGHKGHVFKTSRHGRGGGQSKPERDPTGGHPLCMRCFMHHAEGACDR